MSGRIMNTFSLGVLVMSGLATIAPIASAAEIDFDVQSDYDDNFVLGGWSGVGDPLAAWSASEGIDGVSGRIDTINNTAQAGTSWNTTAHDLDNGPLNISVFFHAVTYSTAANATRIAVGLIDDLSSSSAAQLRDNSYVQVRLINSTSNPSGGRFEIRDAGTGFTNTTGIALTDDNWYRIFLMVTKGAAAGQFDIVARLEDWGADGTVDPGVAVGTATGTRTYAPFYTGSDVKPLYAGFMGQNSNGGTDAFDNFSAAIPEPASLALLGLASGLMLIGRRSM